MATVLNTILNNHSVPWRQTLRRLGFHRHSQCMKLQKVTRSLRYGKCHTHGAHSGSSEQQRKILSWHHTAWENTRGFNPHSNQVSWWQQERCCSVLQQIKCDMSQSNMHTFIGTHPTTTHKLTGSPNESKQQTPQNTQLGRTIFWYHHVFSHYTKMLINMLPWSNGMTHKQISQ